MVDEDEIAVGRQRHRQCAADPHADPVTSAPFMGWERATPVTAIFFGIGR